MDEAQVAMLKDILDRHLDEHIKAIQASREHTNQLIEETIKKTVNGKIDNLKKDLADYIKDDTAWKVKAAPALETYQDLQGFKKITKWLFGIVLAVGSLWTLIEKVK